MPYTTLVFGAAGKFAGLVVPKLLEAGGKVRAFIHSEDPVEALHDLGVTDVVVGDLRDDAATAGALRGVDRVFYIAPAFLEGEAAIGRRIVAQCADAGVERFVFSSVIHPVLSGLSNHAAKAPVEEALIDSGIPCVLLHPALFFQNYAAAWGEIADSGVLAEPWSCDTRFSRVDFRDVAEVATMALTDDRLRWGTFELCAEGWLDRHDVAALAAEALDKEVVARRTDPATLPTTAAPMRPMFEHYDRVGLRGSAVTLRAILGREPRTLAAYFAELAS